MRPSRCRADVAARQFEDEMLELADQRKAIEEEKAKAKNA